MFCVNTYDIVHYIPRKTPKVMKTIVTTLLLATTFLAVSAQRNTSISKGNISTTTTQSYSSSNITNQSTYSRPNDNTNTYNSNVYTYSNDNNNSNNNSNSNYNNNNSNWINTNTYDNNNYYNNNNYNYNNSNYYNNNNNYNGYNSYNNSNYNKNAYVVNDNSYGAQEITEDKTKLTPLSNPYNTTGMLSNFRKGTAIEKLFNQTQKPSQVFIINAQQENTLKATDGTIIKIAPNSFIDKNGDVVKGDVEFEVKEMYNKSDMILSNAHTVSNDMVLKSGGELFLGAERNGQPLTLANNKPIAIEMPAESNGEPMQLFNGKPDRNTVNWNVANNNEVSPVRNPNSSTGYSYNFSANNMNWLNCDKFMPRSGNTKMSVRMDKQFDTTNTAVFIVYRDQNSVTKFDGFSTYDGSTRMLPEQSMFDTKWYSVPTGTNVTIVAISEIKGQYYSSIQNTVIQKDQVMDIMMYPTTLEDFKTETKAFQ